MNVSVAVFHSNTLLSWRSAIPINSMDNPVRTAFTGATTGLEDVEGVEDGDDVEGEADTDGVVEGGADTVGAIVGESDGGSVGSTGAGVGGGAGSQPHLRRENICKAKQFSGGTYPSCDL